jgi:hypothetical protein
MILLIRDNTYVAARGAGIYDTFTALNIIDK